VGFIVAGLGSIIVCAHLESRILVYCSVAILQYCSYCKDGVSRGKVIMCFMVPFIIRKILACD
jgi:hypothetical protein